MVENKQRGAFFSSSRSITVWTANREGLGATGRERLVPDQILFGKEIFEEIPRQSAAFGAAGIVNKSAG
jgi:hypothetical protein